LSRVKNKNVIKLLLNKINYATFFLKKLFKQSTMEIVERLSSAQKEVQRKEEIHKILNFKHQL